MSGSGRPLRRSGGRLPTETPRDGCRAGYFRRQASGAVVDVRNEAPRRPPQGAALAGSSADTLIGVGEAPTAPTCDRKTSFAEIHNRPNDSGTSNNGGGESSELVHHAFARHKRQTGISAKSQNHYR